MTTIMVEPFFAGLMTGVILGVALMLLGKWLL